MFNVVKIPMLRSRKAKTYYFFILFSSSLLLIWIRYKSPGFVPEGYCGDATKIDAEVTRVSKDCRYNANTASNLTIDMRYISPMEPRGRIGNWLYQLASAFGLAQAAGRRLLLRSFADRNVKGITRLFDLNQSRNAAFRDGLVLIDEKLHGNISWLLLRESWLCAYDDGLLRQMRSKEDKDVKVIGYLQAYSYFGNYSRQVRDLLIFRDDVKSIATTYLTVLKKRILLRSTTANGNGDLIFLGIHVRRNDLLHPAKRALGYRVANIAYYYNSIIYLLKRLAKNTPTHFVLIVCSDSEGWFRREFSQSTLSSMLQVSNVSANFSLSIHYPELDRELTTRIADCKYQWNETITTSSDSIDCSLSTLSSIPMMPAVEVAQSNGTINAVNPPPVVTGPLKKAEFDFVLLAHCNHSVMSVGTFGYMASFLAGGITTYYKAPYYPGTVMEKQNFNYKLFEHYPPAWIPLGD